MCLSVVMGVSLSPSGAQGLYSVGHQVPQSNLTHLVVVGYGRFTQLSFEIQLEGKVQVALQVKRGGKERWFSERGRGVMIKLR